MQSHVTIDDALAAERQRSVASTLYGLARRVVRATVVDTWRVPLTAHSRTSAAAADAPMMDVLMPFTPLRAVAWMALCPLLCYPIAFVYGLGYYRCLRTTCSEQVYSARKAMTTTTTTAAAAGATASTSSTTPSPAALLTHERVHYCAQRRTYHPRRRTLDEREVLRVDEIKHALRVTGGERCRFVDDPTQPHVAYYVTEQQIIYATLGLSSRLGWLLSLASDACRYALPVACAYLFRPACRRLLIDLRLCYEGRLRLVQVRHPIRNFFATAAENRRARHRIVVTRAAARGARPWNYRL